MDLLCLKDHNHGSLARSATAKPGDPEYAHEFKKGEHYEVDDKLGVRLLRDYGYQPRRTDVRFEAVDKDEARRLTQEVFEEPFDKFIGANAPLVGE